VEQAQIPKEHDPVKWWGEHYGDAARQVIDFLAGDGIELADKVIADIGSGDGIIDLGIVQKAQPAKLVGYDMRPTDLDALRRSAAAAGVTDEFPGPDQLVFVESQINHLPAPDDSYDVVFSWSVFEHVSQPVRMLQEISRVLKPDGYLVLQIWPLFGSQHGGHAWMAVEEPFAHLMRSPFDMRDELRGRQGTDPTRTADDEFASLNRLTLDELQRALLVAHLRVSKVELIAETVHIPPELVHRPLVDLVVSGVKLLAVPS
jgi:SAM-dependent methyltransferase